MVQFLGGSGRPEILSNAERNIQHAQNNLQISSLRKRDGSIVNNILGEDGNIIADPKKVSSVVIGVLKDIQLSEKSTEYSRTLPFPDLLPLNEDEIKLLLSKLATGKALSFDLFSGMLTPRSLE